MGGVIGRGLGRDAITLTGVPNSLTLDDQKDIQTFLQKLYASGTLLVNSNTYFPIHFAPGFSFTGVDNFCAYHSTIRVFNGSAYVSLNYGVIPDQAKRNGCPGNVFSASSHELIEAITDPLPNSGWTDPLAPRERGGEIGDFCNTLGTQITDSNGRTWTVQQGWSNKNGGCYPPATCLQDGTACVFGITCNSCCNKPLSFSLQCGSSCYPDNTVCLAGTTCNNCCNKAYNALGTQCGGSCYPDNTVCGAGTTCNLCCNKAYSFDGTQCGGSCYPDNTVCGAGTTCNLCCNKAYNAAGTQCGGTCYGSGTTCGLGTTCELCCNGHSTVFILLGIGKCN